jgi:hypothetical protein
MYPSPEPSPAMPLHLWVFEPPPSPRNRLTCAVRLIMVIPQFIVLFLVDIVLFFAAIAGWFAAVVTGRLPAGLREFSSGVVRWHARVGGYLFFLTDVYPPFSLDEEEAYPVRIAIPPPVQLNQAAVLVRIFIAIPGWIVTSVLGAGLGIVSIGSWFMLLVTGQLPVSLFEASRAVIRYQERFYGYLLMLTPEYPWGAFGDDTGMVSGPQRVATDPFGAWSIRLSDGGRAAMIVIIVLGIVSNFGNRFWHY